MEQPADSVRIDKWLWAARLFKTRSLATSAIRGGHVHVNGERPRPARPLRVGDRLRVRRGDAELELQVLALSERRGPAREAEQLYEETDASAQRREEQRERRRLQRHVGPERRPHKKDRRAIRRLSRGEPAP